MNETLMLTPVQYAEFRDAQQASATMQRRIQEALDRSKPLVAEALRIGRSMKNLTHLERRLILK